MIENIASFNQYEPGTTVAMNAATVPQPYLGKVRYIWSGTYYNYLSCNMEIPPVEVDPDQRYWLAVRPNASHGTRATHCVLTVSNQTIDPSIAIPGNTVRFGFKFATSLVGGAGQYLGWRAPSTTAVIASAVMTRIETLVSGSNQYHWIDFIFKYEENVIKIYIYSDKDLIHSFEANYNQHWAVGAGNIAASITNAVNYNQGFYFNDFITVVDNEIEGDVTGDVGPISVLPLEVDTVTHNDRWKAPGDLSIEESLGRRLNAATVAFPDNELIKSDPFGGELKVSFKAPEEELRPILAFQQFFIGQKPASMGANFKYRFLKNGETLGEEVKIDTGTSLNAFQVYMPTVDLSKRPEAAIDEIKSFGVAFSSEKKVIDL